MCNVHKPNCPLIGANDNIFNLLGLASNSLKSNDMADSAKEMVDRVLNSGSYDEALSVIMEYVNPVGPDEVSPQLQ